jgi:hypothetical protein
MRPAKLLLVLASQGTLLALSSVCLSDSGSKADLEKQYHNPLGSLKALPTQLDIDFGIGSNDETSFVYSLQPIWPFQMTKSWDVVTYFILPISSQPGTTPAESRTSGLGDSILFAYFTPKKARTLIWGVGPAVRLPTATSDALGAQKWAAGPALVLGVQPGNWTIFGLFDNVWSFAGRGDDDVNEFTFQYYVTCQFPKGWFYVSNLVIDADWEAERGDRWTVPIGGGFGNLFAIGKQAMAVYAQGAYKVKAPSGGSDWTTIIGTELVFP